MPKLTVKANFGFGTMAIASLCPPVAKLAFLLVDRSAPQETLIQTETAMKADPVAAGYSSILASHDAHHINNTHTLPTTLNQHVWTWKEWKGEFYLGQD